MPLFATGQPARIVIAGGGYAGLHAAAGLAARLDPGRARLTVVQPGLRFVDICRLHEAALDPVSISYSLQDILGRLPVDLIDGSVQEVDRSRHTLTLDAYGHPADLPWDYLVLAGGSGPADFGIPGVREHALPLKTADDAERIRAQLAEVRRLGPSATAVVAGAGLTGVEMASEIAARWNRIPVRRRPQVILVDTAARLLPLSHEDAADYSHQWFRRNGVRIRLSSPIAAVEKDRLVFRDGSAQPAEAIIWCAGIRVPPMTGLEDLYTGPGGRIPVSETLETASPGIFAIGDQAALAGRDGTPVPPRAMYACQMGDSLAGILSARLRGKSPRPFRPQDQGELLSLGRLDGAGYVRAGSRRIPVYGKAAAAMKAASLQAHLFRLMGELRRPILPEGSLIGDVLGRLRGGTR